MLYLAILICALLFAGVAMTVNEGLWSNAIALMSVMLGGLAGIFLGVPAGNFLSEQAGKGPDNAWYFVFAGVWGVFTVAVLLTRVVADRTSRTKMRFIPLVDKFGGPLVGILVAVMFASFAAYTLDRIPIKAGEWKYTDSPGFAQSVFTYVRAPFWNVANAFASAESIDKSFISSNP